MGSFREFGNYDGLGLASLVRRGEVTSRELCEEAVDRIEKLNPLLNAVIARMDDQIPLENSDSIPSGILAGVPFLVKDLVEAVAHVPLTMGSRACATFVPDHDSEMVSRFRQTGVVLLGKTNVPEFGLMAVTESQLHGPCRNPWDTGYTPGGSSGGSASAVAAGMVPLASGNDGGGSIRIPSSCCGLFGLKPTRGRTPTGPDVGQLWQGAAVSHVITRSVRDSAAMLDATQGPEAGPSMLLPPPDRSYLEEASTDPPTLRIGFSHKSPLGTPVDPECRVAVENTAKLLEELGHIVEPAKPGINGRLMVQSFLSIVFGEVSADLDGLKAILGRKIKASDVEPLTWTMGLLGRTFSAGDFARATRYWGSMARAMGRYHQKYDLFLTPTTAFPPSKIGALQPGTFERIAVKIVNSFGVAGILKPTGFLDQLAEQIFSRIPFTPLANATGQPAMSVPLHWTPNNLPCGVQFTARFGDEATLFRLAGQLERARPWFDRHGRVWAG